MVVKTYRGLLADDSQDRIRLQTIKGNMGYKIIKFQAMPNNFNATDEYNLTIWKFSPTTLTTTFNFTDNDLLAALYFENSAAATETPTTGTVIFDNEVFNQDIYIGLKTQSGFSCNYYIELEVIPLASDEAAITTVKAMRGTAVD